MKLDPIGIGAVAESIKGVLGMFFADKTEEERQKMALTLAMVQGQLDANKEEAKSPSLFVAGWRPAAGWVCVAALGMIYIPKAVVLTGLWSWQAFQIVAAWSGAGTMPALPSFPDLGVTDLIGLLMAMLGMGVMRSFDKVQGVDTKAHAPKAPKTGPQPDLDSPA